MAAPSFADAPVARRCVSSPRANRATLELAGALLACGFNQALPYSGRGKWPDSAHEGMRQPVAALTALAHETDRVRSNEADVLREVRAFAVTLQQSVRRALSQMRHPNTDDRERQEHQTPARLASSRAPRAHPRTSCGGRGSRPLWTVLNWTPRPAYTSACGEAISR
jgi:hypothetical protein